MVNIFQVLVEVDRGDGRALSVLRYVVFLLIVTVLPSTPLVAALDHAQVPHDLALFDDFSLRLQQRVHREEAVWPDHVVAQGAQGASIPEQSLRLVYLGDLLLVRSMTETLDDAVLAYVRLDGHFSHAFTHFVLLLLCQ